MGLMWCFFLFFSFLFFSFLFFSFLVPKPTEGQHVRCGRTARRATQVDPVLQRRDGHHLRDGLLFVQHGPQRRSQSEPTARVARSLQIHLEQPMAQDHIRHPLLKQTGSLVVNKVEICQNLSKWV